MLDAVSIASLHDWPMQKDADGGGIPRATKVSEGRALKALWDARRAGPNPLSQADFSVERLELSAGYLPQFFGGIRPLTLRIAKKFADYIGCSVAEFSPRLAKEAEREKSLVEWPFDFDPELLEGLSPGQMVALSGMIKGWIIDQQTGGKSTPRRSRSVR